jgi:DNA topoisomerase-6 subunit B
MVNTAKNEPEILVEREVEWERPRGTRIELELEGTYVRARRQSVYAFLKNVSIVNPHARITLMEPDGKVETFERATDEMPKKAYEIPPHPDGIELGELIKRLRYTERKKLYSFLRESFSGIGSITAQELCNLSGLDPETAPSQIPLDDAKRLLAAFKRIKVKSPPTDCLSPIGESLIRSGLQKEYKVDFIATTTRPVSVFSGNPFQVEVGLAYGGELERDARIEILRFANRVPLVYQQGACAITHAVEGISWKSYSLEQPGGGIPVGPAVLLVHIASTNIPFTSESKDAIADMPAILEELDLGMKECGRKLRRYLSRQDALSLRREKEEIIRKILPRIARKLSDVLEMKEPDIGPVVARIMGNVLVKKRITSDKGCRLVQIFVENHTEGQRAFKLHDLSAVKSEKVDPPARIMPAGNRFDYLWNIALRPGEKAVLTYEIGANGNSPAADSGEGSNQDSYVSEPVVEGLDQQILTGARVMG